MVVVIHVTNVKMLTGIGAVANPKAAEEASPKTQHVLAL